MNFKLVRGSGYTICRGNDCKKLETLVSAKGRIKRKTVCLKVTGLHAGGVFEMYFCKDCINDIYEYFKQLSPTEVNLAIITDEV